MKPLILALFATLMLIACSEQSPVTTDTQSPAAAQPTELALALLREREGYKETVYVDGEGKAIAGLGHKLNSTELSQYPAGTEVPAATLATWEQQDTATAWNIAAEQASEIGEPRLTEGLFAVVFQLGPHWNHEHKQTWKHLKNQQWQSAAEEAQDSAWYRQTPQRVEDFQRALKGL